MSEQEIRIDFAEKIKRRMKGMLAGVRCSCPDPRDHLKPCEGYYWQRAAWIVDDVLQEQSR